MSTLSKLMVNPELRALDHRKSQAWDSSMYAVANAREFTSSRIMDQSSSNWNSSIYSIGGDAFKPTDSAYEVVTSGGNTVNAGYALLANITHEEGVYVELKENAGYELLISSSKELNSRYDNIRELRPNLDAGYSILEPSSNHETISTVQNAKSADNKQKEIENLSNICNRSGTFIKKFSVSESVAGSAVQDNEKSSATNNKKSEEAVPVMHIAPMNEYSLADRNDIVASLKTDNDPNANDDVNHDNKDGAIVRVGKDEVPYNLADDDYEIDEV